MTEREWLAGDDPAAMLRKVTGELRTYRSGHQEPTHRVSDRKLRLFAAAMWRGQPAVLARLNALDLPDVAERLADGVATEADLARSRDAIWAGEEGGARLPWPVYVRQAAAHMLNVLVPEGARGKERARQAALLRDLVGDPWRPVALPFAFVRCPECGGKGEAVELVAGSHFSGGRHAIVPCERCHGVGNYGVGCLWLTPTVLSLARPAYDERRADGTLFPDRLAVLADALEDAGCDNADVLRHLRSPGPHARGCWALDLTLGKE